MSIGIVGVVFVIVAFAELPDKTMIATVVMGSRSRPILVWIGCSAAFAVHVGLAVVAGRLLMLLSHRDLLVITTVIFLAGATYLLVVPEGSEVQRGEQEAAKARPTPLSATNRADPSNPLRPRPAGEGLSPTSSESRIFGVIATAFGVILIGEFGDLTQLLTVNLVARYHQPLSVFVGALGALVAVSAIGSFGGRALLRVIPLTAIRRAGAIILIGFSAYNIYSIIR